MKITTFDTITVTATAVPSSPSNESDTVVQQYKSDERNEVPFVLFITHDGKSIEHEAKLINGTFDGNGNVITYPKLIAENVKLYQEGLYLFKFAFKYETDLEDSDANGNPTRITRNIIRELYSGSIYKSSNVSELDISNCVVGEIPALEVTDS